MTEFREIWSIIKKYLFDIWGVIIGTWYLVNYNDFAKINQVFIFFYLLMLIKFKIDEKRGKKNKESKLTKLYRKVIKKNKSVKYLDVGETAENQVDSLFSLSEKLKNGGLTDMKKILEIVGKLVYANKITLGATSVLFYIYFEYVKWLFEFQKYEWTPYLIKWLCIATGVVLLFTVAFSGFGLESLKRWAIRTSNDKLQKYLIKLQEFQITTETTAKIKETIKRAKNVLEFLKPEINDDIYKKALGIIEVINSKVFEFEAELILKAEEEKERAVQFARQLKQNQTNQPNDHIKLR